MSKPELKSLDQGSIQSLLEIFNVNRSSGNGVDSIVYRAQHEHQLSLLDELEQKGYLRKDGAGRYLITLYGLSNIDSPYIRELLGHFEKIFSVMREHYKIMPREELKLSDLASLSELTLKEVSECVGYMIESSLWSSHSTNLQDPGAHIKPSESILRYQTFQDVVSEIRHREDEREAQLFRKARVSIFQGDIEDVVASALKPEGPIFSLLFELDSDEIQRITERAGLVPDWSLTNTQAFSHRTRKRVYRQRITAEYSKLSAEQQQRFILNVARELTVLNRSYEERINETLRSIGWALVGDKIIQIDALHPSDVLNLPQATIEDLAKAAERLPNDPSGAISAACGAIDSVCEKIYKDRNLGDSGKASFQEKIKKSIAAVKALENLHTEILAIGWEKKEADIFCHNLNGAISHAAHVMQSLRSNMGDVHGSKPYLAILAFDSIKWAMIISSLLREKQ
ncbi:MAG: hypothetical protein ABIF87_04960 [Pseudomonadota bacterium]